MGIVLVDNVLLHHGATGIEVDLQPHLGLISLIAVLRAQGEDATLYDPKLDLVQGHTKLGNGFYDSVAQRILDADPEMVGFTSLGCNFVCTARIAEEVRRRRPGVPILLGGPHASIVDLEILQRYPQFDAIVRNEAEGSISRVLDAVGGYGKLSEVEGVTYRDLGGPRRTKPAERLIDLDELPLPAYDAFPIRELGLRSLNVDAGRGCPFQCTFCSTASYFGRRYRLRSASRLVDLLDHLYAAYDVRHFGLTHDLFTVNKKKVRAFCEAVATRGYTWTCSARMDCVDDALLSEMRDAGCTSIYYGVETGSERLQPLIGKDLDLGLYHPILATSLRLGMKVTASLITGYPDETVADQDATVALIEDSIKRYPRDLSMQLHLLTPEPGTALHALYASTLRYDGHINDFNFPALDADDEQLMASDAAVFVCHHYYAKGLDRAQNIALTDAFRTLYGLGHVVLERIRRAYDAPLGAMLRDFGVFLHAFHASPAETLRAFVRQTCGRDQDLLDVIEYLAAVSELRIEENTRVMDPEPEMPIRLARCIVPVDAARDGEQLLRQLYAGESGGHTTTASHHLLVAGADVASNKMFAVDRLTFEISKALERSTTRRRLEAQFDRCEVESRIWALGLMGAIVQDDCADKVGEHSSLSLNPLQHLPVSRSGSARRHVEGRHYADPRLPQLR